MAGIPFKAALFDLDGTLLDSMYVWSRVDEVFFAARGIPLPEDYGRAIAGKSFRESAQYTVERYLPGERWQDVCAEWTRLSELEYAHNVRLKSGAMSYLRMLRREGVKLAVATALTPKLFEPCLRNLGIDDLFDAFCSTEHTGGHGKASGEVYLLAAEKLGVAPEDCAVFEDVLAGVEGAKAVGMRAYCVRDSHSEKDFDAIARLADGMIDSFDEMRAHHAFAPSPRCVIFTARCEGDLRAAYAPEPGDRILCADGGWKLARELGVQPELVIGDFDSLEAPESGAVERHPVMKDDTDTMLCIKHGLRAGCERFWIVGGFGGRFDHTMANIQSLAYAASRGASAGMADGFCRVYVLKDGAMTLARRPGKLSLFALGGRCRGVTLRGALYPLEDAELVSDFPLGVSNEYAADEAEISVAEGMLLIVQTGDREVSQT